MMKLFSSTKVKNCTYQSGDGVAQSAQSVGYGLDKRASISRRGNDRLLLTETVSGRALASAWLLSSGYRGFLFRA